MNTTSSAARRSFPRRCPARTHALYALASATLLGGTLPGTPTARAANTENDVLTSATALDSAASYSGGLPTASSDVTFTNSTYSNTTFTFSARPLDFGTLNDLDTTQSLTISGSSKIRLAGGGDTVAGSAAGDLLYVASGANLTITDTAAITLLAGNIDIAGTGQATINAPLTAASGVSLTKTGTGTLLLTGTNVFGGQSGTPLTIINSGTLEAASPGSLPGYNSSNGVNVNSGGTVAVAVGGSGGWNAANVDTLRSNTTFSSGSALGIDTAGAGAGGFTYASNIAGNLGLTKLGVGTLTLTGASTYTGATTVSAGTLALSGSGSLSGTSSVTVSGTSAGPASLSMAPGTSLTSTGGTFAGTLTVGTNGGTGTFTQTGGSFTNNNGNIFLGYGGGSTGSYTLSGTGSLSTGSVFIGYHHRPGEFAPICKMVPGQCMVVWKMEGKRP